MRTFNIDKINLDKLISNGFIINNNTYIYKKDIIDNKFKVIIEINNKMTSKVIDNKTNEEYLMVDIEGASGNYVGKIKEEYENTLNEILKFISNKHNYSHKLTTIINYIKDTYQDKPEYLWKSTPNAAAIRNQNNNKWYAVIMEVIGSKLGLDSNEEIEVINVRYQKNRTNEIIDNLNIFPAWHMNKSSWISININSELDIEIIYSLIDNSYDLSKK